MDAPPISTTATAAETATIRAMEKPSQDQIQQQQQPLRCPRCESTNTKFCYYNNYSLSQPRHFCKACKRYWTRGGNLRSVPVGGGCRKNKRVRRPNSNTSSYSSAARNISSSINEQNTFTSQCLNPNGGGGAHFVNPKLFGFPTNLRVPHRSSHDVISSDFQFSGFENHHQQNQYGGFGLGFSSNGMLGASGFSTPEQIPQDLISNSNPSLVSTTTSCTTTVPTVSCSSLLTSSLQHHKFNFKNPSLMSYHSDLGMKGMDSHGNEGAYNMKNDHVKLEDDGTHNRQQPTVVNYEIHGHHQQSSMEASGPSILWSNNSNNGACIGGNWLDPSFSSISSS